MHKLILASAPMTQEHQTFYITGGTLRHDAPSYVERKADRELLDGLLKGEFCYVLTSRQMGKSSLMVRTASKLREKGVAVVVLDLTAIGQNVSPEQWYHGLLVRAGRQVELEEQLDEFWDANPKLSPVQRFISGVRDIVLIQRKQPLVIFVDEIDTVRSLPFSTDEFFAAIRECYNRRTEDPEFNRLTFCLLGVATPSDLIRDTRITPFNIGRRIELHDFTPDEAAPLAAGLQRSITQPSTLNSQQLLARILHWTNGHPYLTQRLCQAVAQEGLAPDEACAELFFSTRARERDDNLIFVRERLLHSEVNQAELLHLYEQVLAGKKVADDETNSLVSVLRLSGIVRSRQGFLEERNRIYKRAFDEYWVRANMPDAEIRRQRAAYRKGFIRAAALAGLIIAVIGGLFLYARNQAIVARKNLYAADMSLATQAWQEGNLGRVLELLQRHQPRLGQPDVRGWEWRFLWRQTRTDELFTLGRHASIVADVALSPNARQLASASFDRSVKIWDLENLRELKALPHPRPVRRVVYSRDGQQLVTGSEDGYLRFWRTADWTLSREFNGGTQVQSLVVAADGRTLAIASSTGGAPGSGVVRVWDSADERLLAEWHISAANPLPVGIAFSPDQKFFAFSRAVGEIAIWDLARNANVASLHRHSAAVLSLSFSPDGTKLVSGSLDNTVRVWDMTTYQEQTNLSQFASWIGAITFSRDGRLIVAGGADQRIRIWDAVTFAELAALKGHSDEVWSITITPDGSRLFTGSKDDTVRCWSVIPDKEPKPDRKTFPSPVSGRARIHLSPDNTALATVHGMTSARSQIVWRTDRLIGSPVDKALPANTQIVAVSQEMLLLTAPVGKLILWDSVRQQIAATLAENGHPVRHAAFSPQAKFLAVARDNHQIEVWHVADKTLATTFTGEARFLNRLLFSPDANLLAAAYDEGTLLMWRMDDFRLSRAVNPHKLDVNAVAFSFDGRFFATAGSDARVKLWDTATARHKVTMAGDLNSFASVAFSPDGRRLAGGSENGLILLWDLTTDPPQEVARFKAHQNPAEALAFLDADTLLSVTIYEVRAWRAAPFSEIIRHSTQQAKVR